MRLCDAPFFRRHLPGMLAGSLLFMVGLPLTVWSASLADTVEKIKPSIVAIGTGPTHPATASQVSSDGLCGRSRPTHHHQCPRLTRLP